MRHGWTFLSLAAVVAASGCSGGGQSRAGEYVLITGGWVFTGTTDSLTRNTGILVGDSIILAMGGATAPKGENVRVLELGDDDYVIPGLFDLHAHYAVDLLGKGRVDETNAYPQIFLANGVTSTFPAGEVNPERMRSTRIAIDAGERPGPRIFNSGPYFGRARAGWDAARITRDSLRAEVAYWVGQGVKGFKAKGIDPEHLKWLIEAAHEHGLTVTGHLDSGFRDSVNPRDAILMGIDRIEHFMGGDAMPGSRSAYDSFVHMKADMPEFQAIMDLFKERGVFYDATRSAYGYYGKREPEVFEYFVPELEFLTPHARNLVEARLPRRVVDRFEQIYWVKRDLIGEFYRQGGGEWITLGTDHPSWGEYFSGFGVHREMHALNKAGIPPAAVLRIATINGARALRVDDRLGTLEAGKLADLVVLSGNPLEDIRNTRHVQLVMKNGKTYSPQELLASARGKIGPVDEADEVNWQPAAVRNSVAVR